MKKSKEPLSPLKSILICAALTLILMLVLCVLCATLLQSKASPEDYYRVSAIVIPVSASLIGGLLCALFSKGKGLVRGFFVGVLAGLLINLAGLVIAPTATASAKDMLLAIGYCALSGALGGFFGVNLLSRKP